MNKLQLIISLWHNTKWFLFSASLSTVIVLWDIEYADKFNVNVLLFIIMMIQLELSYVLLPYMHGPKVTLTAAQRRRLPMYKTLPWRDISVAVFFLATITPAALQITDQLIEKRMEEVKTEPTKPTKPVVDENLDMNIRRVRWDIQQGIGNETTNQKILSGLLEQQAEYASALNKYNKDIQAYPEKVSQYKEYQTKSAFTKFVDYFTMLFGFIALIALQIMNGYSSRKGAEQRGRNVISFQAVKPEVEETIDDRVASNEEKPSNEEQPTQPQKDVPWPINRTPEHPLPGADE